MSTAVQRFGHVLGWTGNVVAVVALLVGLGFVGSAAKQLYDLHYSYTAFTVTIPTGTTWEVLAPKGYSDKQQAIDVAMDVSAGKKVPEGWTIFEQGKVPVEKLPYLDELKKRVSYEILTGKRNDAWEVITFAGGISLVFAALAYFGGRALRYIFSGPNQ